MKLIVGLGNPGRLYVNNRHNVGFRCLDYFARKQRITLNHRKARSKFGVGEVNDIKVVLAKPRTFMNLSGEAVAALMRRHRVVTKDLLVIYDDLDLPLGAGAGTDFKKIEVTVSWPDGGVTLTTVRGNF